MLLQPLTSIKGIGTRRAETLGGLGLFCLRDLLYYAPRNYTDYSRAQCACELKHGTSAAVRVRLTGEPKLARVNRKLNILTAACCDETGKLTLVWYNQPFRKASLKTGEVLYACGRADMERGTRLLNPMLCEALPGIVPVYALPKGISQKVFRDTVRAALDACADELEETLPAQIISRYGLCSLSTALCELHFPQSAETLRVAKRRLSFEDMLVFSLMLDLLREQRKGVGGIAFHTEGLHERFLKLLPFAPTRGQLVILEQIERDMEKGEPMNRLVQGDVGSGKTVLALYAMYIAVQNGYQAALMAPTEILAQQHFAAVSRIFGADAALLKGGMKKSERDHAYLRIASGEAKAVVGTHALITDALSFSRLGLVVADEQHRFGVRQRAAIGAKGEQTDVLIMSATPIPRTLSLILYGDLDVSVLSELPPGRHPVKTSVVPREKRDAMYLFLEAQAARGEQSYAVCPLVEKSDQLMEALSAQELYEELKEKLSVRVGLLHGQMKNAEKESAMRAFVNGETDVLVCTTVVEVGVDVKNATVMVVENAERFGLAQLHQLRGRVGRGEKTSYCFLLSSEAGSASERLNAMTATNDGFLIAEKDLQMRGPGEFLGERQHGLTGFEAARFAADMQVLEQAREAAGLILEHDELRTACEPLVLLAKKRLADKGKTIAPN